jgi:c-di-GMP-binding flagellar brake protein YcgR
MKRDSERRKFKRGPLLLPITFTMNSVSKEGYISNISIGGCRLYCYSTFPVKKAERIEIFLRLKNSPDSIGLRAQIIRVNPFIVNPDFRGPEEINCELGVKFLSLNKSQKEALENYTTMVLSRMKQD